MKIHPIISLTMTPYTGKNSTYSQSNMQSLFGLAGNLFTDHTNLLRSRQWRLKSN
jgi:hypothetical protein